MLAERLTAQLLAGTPAHDPVTVAERLLAIQGQDPRGARLAIRARSVGLDAGDINQALSTQRTLLITWLNRGTLHLVRSEDYPWLADLVGPTLLRGNARRLAQEGVTPHDAERAVRVIELALTAAGPLTRIQLRERIRAAGIPTQGQALVHLLMLASLRGVAVRGPMIGRQHAYALVRDWLAQPARIDRDQALAELARRYLAGHGPADDRDLARWAGLPLRDARRGLAAIASELAQRSDGLVDLVRRREAPQLPPPRLLGAFDPVLLGWKSREPIVGAHGSLIMAGGMFRPFAMVRGRAVATWSVRHGTVSLEPFTELARGDMAALKTDADDVARFLTPSLAAS